VTSALSDLLPADPPSYDQFVRLNGVSFREYEAVLAMRGECSTPRITYLEGVLELMSPSRQHEKDKTRFARLLEAWAEERGIDIEGLGSWTLRDEKVERGAEPDECYTVGRVPASEDDKPDLAVEVVWTSGGIDKLEVYRKLGIQEVWFYARGTLRFYALRGESYESMANTELFPGFDPGLMVRCMSEGSQAEAVRLLRAVLRS
jgi:Uma2 family endonuclease